MFDAFHPLRGRFQLLVEPEWDAIQRVWDPCSGFLKEQGLHPDVCYALAMSTQELLENAVKYGDYSGGQKKVELVVEVGKTDVTIEVRSPVSNKQAELLDRFDHTIQWIRGYQNPFEAYVEKLKDVSSQPFSAGKSGLGLTRIAYEGQCILDFYVDDKSTLSVSAVYHR
jgi:hypothetical protein